MGQPTIAAEESGSVAWLKQSQVWQGGRSDLRPAEVGRPILTEHGSPMLVCLLARGELHLVDAGDGIGSDARAIAVHPSAGSFAAARLSLLESSFGAIWPDGCWSCLLSEAHGM
ncbi:MAG: hypothetical protein WD645_06710, partial [Dehalococcoidia bacterium]